MAGSAKESRCPDNPDLSGPSGPPASPLLLPALIHLRFTFAPASGLDIFTLRAIRTFSTSAARDIKYDNTDRRSSILYYCLKL